MSTVSHETSNHEILVICENGRDESADFELFGHTFHVSIRSSSENKQKPDEIIGAHLEKVSAIGIDTDICWPAQTPDDRDVVACSPKSECLMPVYNGQSVRPSIESLSLHELICRYPSLFDGKRILLLSGMGATAMRRLSDLQGATVHEFEPLLHSRLPYPLLKLFNKMIQRCYRVSRVQEADKRPSALARAPVSEDEFSRLEGIIQGYDVIVGDMPWILKLGDTSLNEKCLLTLSCTSSELDQLRGRGVATVIQMMPAGIAGDMGISLTAAMIEAMLAAITMSGQQFMSEDFCLNELSKLPWQPQVTNLASGRETLNKFAFIIHPLSIHALHANSLLGWTRLLPDILTERLASYMPALRLSTITGAQSISTGQKVEGYLYALPMTPHMLKTVNEKRAYRRIHRIACDASRRGAKIIGLGAYTSVVGDAGVTIARQSPIAVTSGNSLTVAVTLEACRKAFKATGTEIRGCTAMVVGATGSIGTACCWLLAEEVQRLVLVSVDPGRLAHLRDKLLQCHPNLSISIATSTAENIDECDLTISATSAYGQRLIDIADCKPGAVIFDVSMPPDISEEESALRPDVLVISGGEVRLPGVVDVGYDIGLPEHTVYACLAETALLAMDGRFEDYTIGRELDVEKVKAIYNLFLHHGGEIAGLRSFGKTISDEEIRKKWDIALGLNFIHSYRSKAVTLAHEKQEQLQEKHEAHSPRSLKYRLCDLFLGSVSYNNEKKD